MRLEQIWLKKAQRGDGEAYAKAFQLYENDLYRLAYVQTNNIDDALDLVQEVAYRSFKSIHTLKELTYFKTWLIRILINATNDYWKKRKVYEELDELIDYEGVSVAVDMQITLEVIMNYLSPTEKQIIFLKYYEDFTFEQIATVTDMKLGSVKTVLYRALNKLRAELEKEGFDEYQRRIQ